MAQNNPPPAAPNDEQFARQLAWKQLDGQLEEEEAEQLELLLTHSAAARRAYVDVVQLHVNLLDHFGALSTCDELLKKTLAAQPPKAAAPAPIPPAPIPVADGAT